MEERYKAHPILYVEGMVVGHDSHLITEGDALDWARDLGTVH